MNNVKIPTKTDRGWIVEIDEDFAAELGVAKGSIALAIGLIMALAPIGCAIGMGLIGSAGLSGIARNPAAQGKIFIPMIISLAFIEAFVIFGLLVSFTLAGKI